jgi:D-alanyl-D-alanine carboxypeptidase/D-alanyl-D-alanine-endopeptidase (penicillin-binding protein 4)
MSKNLSWAIRFYVLCSAAVLLASCSNSVDTENENGTSSAQIDNVILRPAGSKVMSRPLLYAQDPTMSYCESTAGQAGTYSGYQDLKPYPLASVSKVFLSTWALKKLGPDYRFQMNWKLKRISADGTFDAYLQTNYDPVVNIEKILFALSELNKKGVKRIRTLVIDESTRIYLSVLSNPHLELTDVPVSLNQSVENLRIILNSTNWAAQTEIAKNNVSFVQIPSLFSVENISYLPRSQIHLSNYNQQVQIPSAILAKYIKNLNVFSNNYVSDALFQFLGGEAGFKEFQKNELKISTNDLQIYTGSGLSAEMNGQRIDNRGSCFSVLKTLKYLDQLTAQTNLNLGHVLLTAGLDQEGTFDSDLNFNQNVVLKTGRLFDVPTLNVAGVSTSVQGRTYFAMLAHDFDNSDEAKIKQQRDRLIVDLIQLYPQKKSFLTMKKDTLFFK